MNQMNGSITPSTCDPMSNYGRKGIAYDWQSLYAEAQVAVLDRELASLAPQYAT